MNKRIIIGLGSGHCRMRALADLLSAQPSSRVGVGLPPWLPWKPRPEGPTIRGKIATWRKLAEATVGDVAASYLPYAEEAIVAEPEVRLICLERPVEEVVHGFHRQAEAASPTPMDHWSVEPTPGRTQHPILTPTFPQYETTGPAEGVARYCVEYRDLAHDIARRFPRNFRIFDAAILATEGGRHEVLDFAGIPREGRVVALDWPEQVEPASPSRLPAPLDPRRCVVLVPFGSPIVPECEAGLRALERIGYSVRRVGGYAAIDQARNQMATDALLDGFEETLWIDADIGFRAEDVEAIRRLDVPIACGVYPQKGSSKLACHVLPRTPRLVFGADGGPEEILYAAGGFLHVRRLAYLAIQRRLDLPVCNQQFGRPTIPFFEPMVLPTEVGPWYLAEDFAFSERARRAGFRIVADTRLRLWHVGSYCYGWEDAGIGPARYKSFTLNLDTPDE